MSTQYQDLEITKYPFIGYAPNLIDYFLIIGYDHLFIENELKKQIEERQVYLDSGAKPRKNIDVMKVVSEKIERGLKKKKEDEASDDEDKKGKKMLNKKRKKSESSEDDDDDDSVEIVKATKKKEVVKKKEESSDDE